MIALTSFSEQNMVQGALQAGASYKWQAQIGAEKVTSAHKYTYVAAKADDKTIKSAYRRLARKHHPDVAKGKKDACKDVTLPVTTMGPHAAVTELSQG